VPPGPNVEPPAFYYYCVRQSFLVKTVQKLFTEIVLDRLKVLGKVTLFMDTEYVHVQGDCKDNAVILR